MSKHHGLKGRTILQVIPTMSAGGAERTAVDVAEALVKAGARALVASEGGRLLAELERVGGEAISLPLKSKNPLQLFRNIALLEDVIRKESVDTVHARSRAPGWSAYFAARRTKTPFVTTYHGLYNQRTRIKSFYNSIMARGDVVIANSHFTKATIVARHGTPAERVAVIHRGTDFSRFDPDSDMGDRVAGLLTSWGVPMGARVVLLPGRLTSWKGQEVFIDAAAHVLSRTDKQLIFVMVGDEQGRMGYLEGLRQRIARHNISEKVRIAGHCADMPAAFAAADIMVSASTQPEAFGRVAVEAQSMRKPVIVTELGAVAETVLAPPRVDEDGRTGWYTPPSNAEALGNAILEILNLDETRLAMIGAHARAHVLKNFSLENMTDATLGIYQTLIKRKDA